MHYMRRGGWASKYRAHIISFVLIGLWHGANWTFIAFGLYWGLIIAGYLYIQERLNDLPEDSALRFQSKGGAAAAATRLPRAHQQQLVQPMVVA
jgi:D-alanyl-lipoteichoic acid acyltransferase DltB (MBOAT superfamily)